MSTKNHDLANSIMANAPSEPHEDEFAQVIMSIRPGEKISALLELVSRLTPKSPSEFASENMSESLFLFLTSSNERLQFSAQQVTEIMDKGGSLQKGSALDLLVERGILEIRS